MSSGGAVTSLAQTRAEWWRQAVVYEICPHRYGDLPGITSRIPYLASLGIDAVCLSPFQARGGFRELTSRLHPYGIEVIVEFGPDYARFDVLEATWNAGEFLQVITDSIAVPGSTEGPRPGCCPVTTRARDGPARLPC